MEDLVLPQNLRPYLKKPLGELFSGEEAMQRVKEKVKEGGEVIAVGDVVVEEAEKAGFSPKVKIVDFRVERKDIEPRDFGGKVINVENPPAHITKKLWDAIHEAVNGEGRFTIVVEGEEDLAVLPAVIEADWGDFVIYGQPGEGVVLVESGDDSKFQVGTIIKMILDKEELKM